MKRWRLLVKDVAGGVVYQDTFWTRWGARREGEALTTPPLNAYEVVRTEEPRYREGFDLVDPTPPPRAQEAPPSPPPTS